MIVSAPNGTAVGARVPNTGLIYACPVNPGACSPLQPAAGGKLFDTTGESTLCIQHGKEGKQKILNIYLFTNQPMNLMRTSKINS